MGKLLPMVQMKLQSNGLLFQNGHDGEFGVASKQKNDSIFCSLLGYDTIKTAVQAGKNNIIVMHPTDFTKEQNKIRLVSLTNNLFKDPEFIHRLNDETYSTTIENDFVNTLNYPTTGFSLNVNKAAYSNIRRFINTSSTIPPDAVRIEEMLNYFSLNIASPPQGKGVFNIETRLSNCPWDTKNLLLFINVQAKKTDLNKVPPSNLVFLIDDSGSMDAPNRLPLLKIAFKMLANNLRDIDTVTIITYGGYAGIVLGPTSGAEKQKIIEAIEQITPGGATPGSAGLRMAYEMAKTSFIKGGNNRVILATDGDFNVGEVNEKDLENLIAKYKNSNIYLTCLGVGMGNYKDSKLEVLARFGKGNFAYLDNESEAEKVLVKEFAQTVVSVANDVFLNFNFDVNCVEKHRLIGFDNKQEAVTDGNAILEGGEIGSGHSIMAMFEIKLNNNIKIDTLHINNQPLYLGKIRLQYKLPADTQVQFIDKPVPLYYRPFNNLEKPLQFATSVTMLGQLLKLSKYSANYDFDDVINVAINAAAKGDFLQQEFIKLAEESKKLYSKEIKRKKSKLFSKK